MFPTSAPARALAFAAHPDDIDFGAAGTLARWAREGTEITYCIMTSGDAGGFDPADRSSVSAVRSGEQWEAARQVGVRDVVFLGERDGYLEATHAVIAQVVEQIRRVRPDVVLSMHPERNWDRLQASHPDHLACGEIVTRAVYPAAENPFAYPELAERGLQAYKVPWLWFYGAPRGRENTAVDVSSTVDVKLAAIRVHASQHPDIEGMDASVRRFLQDNARRHGLPEGASAEAFHAVGVNTPETIAGF
ncbi:MULTISPECIES: PIG-L deacetylase family protein [unclassified Arthrobacter]|uniref:PIG-L deacetylase family protein n=1 Tax=unclassified Arthrobacter TaxID=235627 RepID=UPI001E4D73AF|nr:MULTISPECIES: PIG-L deacetylase family protein [unclassified Arthrobacter]MCC9146429.1 PIG-L family deacetylase [Arthrobacter sp. zg-Y919]MDK1277659.1 PIG-L deacetylase family protein [Arthrobacter sp. zg.Y919]WIB02380.1 PIG-L deacetylase family protein [Arthrobacter sp. zg-Y919]